MLRPTHQWVLVGLGLAHNLLRVPGHTMLYELARNKSHIPRVIWVVAILTDRIE